jgi:hypothetical protein
MVRSLTPYLNVRYGNSHAQVLQQTVSMGTATYRVLQQTVSMGTAMYRVLQQAVIVLNYC